MSSKKKIQLERLFYIEFLALFTGQVSRKDLVTRFGISEPAATKDISLYFELAPEVLSYDVRGKKYIFANSKTYFKHDVEQSLFALSGERAIAVDVKHAERLPNWINSSIKKTPSLKIVSDITRCIYQQYQIIADYSSMKSGNKKRNLSPVALINDGLRWHIRCFDHNDSEGIFKDYNLERFSSVERGEKSEIDVLTDEKWNDQVTVQLIPHPKSEHPETILKDYNTTDQNTIEATLKVCTVGYFLKKWQVDCTTEAKKDPKRHQLFLNNKEHLINCGVSEWDFK